MTPEQALEIADRLADPAHPGLPSRQPWWRQSLAHGAPGVAVLHAELAAAGLRPFRRVHAWLTVATSGPVTTGPTTGLFYGAPAVAFALAAASAARPDLYGDALRAMDAAIAADARRRTAAAHARIATGLLPAMSEFDTIRGLAGIGAHLLHRVPRSDALLAILTYLVELTKPLLHEGELLPGWWTLTGPTGQPDVEFPGGHGNFGMAHGVGGPLTLAALAALRGVTVPGQLDAVGAICDVLDSWRADTTTGPRWPYMVTRTELRTRPTRVRHSGAERRPSWCYGTAGLARAQQLAALATGNATRRYVAEHALLSSLADPPHVGLTADPSLCHGHTGLAHVAARAATDATAPTTDKLRRLAGELLHRAAVPPATESPGLLEGAAGVALAALTPLTGIPPATGWDTRLLIA